MISRRSFLAYLSAAVPVVALAPSVLVEEIPKRPAFEPWFDRSVMFHGDPPYVMATYHGTVVPHDARGYGDSWMAPLNDIWITPTPPARPGFRGSYREKPYYRRFEKRRRT